MTSDQQKLKLSNFDILDGVLERALCPECSVSRRYFCSKCLIPMPALIDRLPTIRLPVGMDIIRHPKEKHGKSTGVHCKILAQNDVRLFLYPNFPDYREEKEKAVLIFPDPGAPTLPGLFSSTVHDSQIDWSLRTRVQNATRFVFIDCTWFQVGGMRRHEHFRNIPVLALDGRRTRFWRPQHNQPDGNLATVEAVYYFCLEYEKWCLEKGEETEYDGHLDDLLFFFEYFKKTVEIAEHARQLRRKRNLDDGMLRQFSRVFLGELKTRPDWIFGHRRCSTTPKTAIDSYRPSIFPDKPASSINDDSKLPPSPEISDDLIHHLEQLSLVRFSDESAVMHLLTAVRYAQQLAQVDTDGIDPMYTVLENEALQLRNDELKSDQIADRNVILRNAEKQVEEMYFVAPIGNVPLEEREEKIGHREIKKLRQA